MFDDAEKRLKKWLSFGNKWEEAVELFMNAGNKWKAAKNWRAAGEAFSRASDCHAKLESKHDAASALVEAGQCFRKANNTEGAVQCFQHANELWIDLGRFTNAAKHEKELGDMFKENDDTDRAIKHYRKAADYYMGEDQSSAANSCLLQVADIASTDGRYDEAAELYEQVARSSMDKKLLAYHVKEYLFKAMICHLALVAKQPGSPDIEKAKEKFDRYVTMDLHFNNSREYELLAALITAVETQDEDLVAHAVAEYDAVSTLDEWKTSMLLVIKRSLSPDEVEKNLDLC
eukprot:GGOE01061536.1.p1 GENE.GGOE01061536.1~~GGOE01061536.1.p1  ORF type:complete len:325 (-),score=133.74 GGOE01061536.1:255-1121(-)